MQDRAGTPLPQGGVDPTEANNMQGRQSPDTPLTPIPISSSLNGVEVPHDDRERIFSPEPPSSTGDERERLSKLLHEKLSPLVKVRNNSDGADVPKRIQSVTIDDQRRQQAADQLVVSEADLKPPRLSIPELQTSNTTNHARRIINYNQEAQQPQLRSSNQLEDTLTHLMDGISEISAYGNDNHMQMVRGEHDNGTPFIRSPNNVSANDPHHHHHHNDPSMPFAQAAQQPVYREHHHHHGYSSRTGHASKTHSKAQNQLGASQGGQGLKISIKKNILHSGVGGGPSIHANKQILSGVPQAPQTDVRNSAQKKIAIQAIPSSLDSSMISDHHNNGQAGRVDGATIGTSQFAAAMAPSNGNSYSNFNKEQAQSRLGPGHVATTGGQHEQMEQCQRQRVMSFSEASDTDSNMSMLSYQRKVRGNATQQNVLSNLTFPQSNNSTNSGSDADSARMIRRHRQGPSHHHSRRQRVKDDSVELSDSRPRVRFSSAKLKQANQAHVEPRSNEHLQSHQLQTSMDQTRQQEYVQPQPYTHPYAHQPTPYEKLEEICTNFGETSMFISYEVLSWIIGILWSLLLSCVLAPVALTGLALDYLRHWARRCPRRQNRNHLIRNQVIRAPSKKRKLQIVLDLDMTLAFCSMQTPEKMFAGATPDSVPDHITVHNQEFGGEIYVYKRPHLREFLSKVSQLGQISVFTHHQASYVDPILDKLDSEGRYFKNRFYAEHCCPSGDGEILKDMRYLEPMVEHAAHNVQAPNGQVHYSFSHRLNQAIGIPVFGQSAFSGTVSSVGNQGDITLSKHLLERLVIVDDGILTYNAFYSPN